jgi:hypothetical protein
LVGHELTGWVMVTRQLSIAIAVAISSSVGLGMTRPHLETFAAAPIASVMKIDFDQAFADARQAAGYVDRAHKGDRLPNIKTVSREPALLPNCEPVASPYTDPGLARIVGHCDA